MSTHAGEITLRDLLAWVPDLEIGSLPGVSAGEEDPLDRDVEWVISARDRVPMLPTLRGAELILLPNRVIEESAVPLVLLINEISAQPVAGVVIDTEAPTTTRVPVLTIPSITSELESDINRLLMSRRNDLLRTGAEIERSISELTALGAGPGELIDQLSELLEFQIVVTNAAGAAIYSTMHDVHGIPPVGSGETLLQHQLRRGHTVWIGPVSTNRGALARLTGKRLRDAVQSALDNAEANAPHGAARSLALNQILEPPAGVDPDRLATSAIRAGLPPGSTYRVALHQGSETDGSIRRRLATFGLDFEAGTISGFSAHILISERAHHRWSNTDTGEPWIVFSEPVTSARQLPGATQQAKYLALLRAQDNLTGSEIAFERDHQLGPYRLLYDHWGTERIPRYVESLIGELIREDRRGLLRQTLRAYLEHGGAQRLTAEKLAIHRNTLTYRLRQIRSVLHADPDDPNVRLGLHLALLAAELPQSDPRP